MKAKVLIFPEKPRGLFDLTVLICANGAGHHKRVFGALDLVLKKKPGLRVLVFADQVMTDRFAKDFEPLQRVIDYDGATFVFGVVSPGLDIMAKDPTVYTGGQWFSWMNRLYSYRQTIMDAGTVWADALPQVLLLRPDTIFSSSFTFGPVIKEMWGRNEDELSRVARLYAKQEELLMSTCLPLYVTVGLLSMPFMDLRARVHKVGVMADFEPCPKTPTDPPSIGISGGVDRFGG